MNKRGLIIFSILFLIIIISIQNVSAGPYGYGDSMDLRYSIDDGKIVYGYGDEVKYASTLKPKGINWSGFKELNLIRINE